MDRPQLLGPLSPIPPMQRSSFDFSPNAIIRSERADPASGTPEILGFSIGNISPIEHDNSSSKLQISNSSDEMASFHEKLDSLSFEEQKYNPLDKTNVNNRRFSVESILDDLGLEQYKAELKKIDLISFFLLTDKDLLALGIENPVHREVIQGAIKAFCEV